MGILDSRRARGDTLMHCWRSALLACVALCALLALAAFPAGAFSTEETSTGDGSVSKAAAQAADVAPAQTATLTIIASTAAPDSSSYDANGATVLVVKAGGRYQLVWLASAYDANWNATYYTGAPTTPKGWEEFYALDVPDPAYGNDV